KTKFLKNGEEVKQPKFNEGDQISVEALEDPGGYLSAVNVYWEKAADGASSTSSKNGAPTIDTWKDVPPDAPKADAPQERATEAAPPTSRPDPEDPGPPVLKRGRVADSSRQHDTNKYPDPPPASASAPAPVTPTAATAEPVIARADDRPVPVRSD